MRILMINRSVTENSDAVRIMLQLAHSLQALGHEIYFFATEDRRDAAGTGRKKKAGHWWNTMGDWGWRVTAGRRARHQVSRVTHIGREENTTAEVGEKPLPTAGFSGTYLLSRRRYGLFHLHQLMENDDAAKHM